MKCQISKQYERQRTRPRRPLKIQLVSLFAGQATAQDWGACVPIRSSGVTTWLVSDYVERA